MPYFDNEGIKIYYEIEGTGPDLFMIHGFAENIKINWKLTNWVKILKDENRLILLDCRGHGKSDKPTDSAQYGPKMREDISKLMDHLSVKKANFFGYSMGAWITWNLLLNEPKRINCAILGGFILPSLSDKQTIFHHEAIINAFKAENLEQVKDPIGREFRRFAETTGADLNALAAVMTSRIPTSDQIIAALTPLEATLKRISVPILTVLGSDDFVPGDKTLIANLVPGACHFQIQGKDHQTVVADPKFHMIVRAFLNYVNSN